MTHSSLANDRRARAALPGQGSLFSSGEPTGVIPELVARGPRPLGPVPQVPAAVRVGSARPLALRAQSATLPMRLAFEREAPAPARPPLAWSGPELADDARVEQPSGVEPLTLDAAAIDAFERAADANIRAVESARDYDALRLALAAVADDAAAFERVFQVALPEALARREDFRAREVLAYVRRFSGQTWRPFDLARSGGRSKEAAFSGALAERGRWGRRARKLVADGMRGAREAVRLLGPVAVLVPRARNLLLAGHRVQLDGAVPRAGGAAQERRGVEALDVALRRLRASGERAWPGYMRDLPPVVVSPSGCSAAGGVAGRVLAENDGLYDLHRPGGPAIVLCQDTVWDADPDHIAYVIAHESGHHLWRTRLSNAAKAEWTSLARASAAPLDLALLLAHWPEGQSWRAAVRSLARVRPELAQVLEGEFAHGALQDFSDRERVAEALRRGEPWTAPGRSITAYASRSPEEAFCEALALLLTRGPAAVHDDVAQWVRAVAPHIRTRGNGPRRPPPSDYFVDPLRPIAAPVRSEVVVAAPSSPEELRHPHLWVVASKSGRERPWQLLAAALGEHNARLVLAPHAEAGARVALVPPDDVGVISVRRTGAGVDREGWAPTYVPREARPVEEWDDGRRVQ